MHLDEHVQQQMGPGRILLHECKYKNTIQNTSNIINFILPNCDMTYFMSRFWSCKSDLGYNNEHWKHVFAGVVKVFHAMDFVLVWHNRFWIHFLVFRKYVHKLI